MIRRTFKWIFVAAGALAGLVLTAALGMILWGDPTFDAPPGTLQDALAAAGDRLEQPYLPAARTFRMRDGAVLSSQYIAASSKTTIVLVHGILASSFPLNRSSGLLREAGKAEVVAIDLRGHGKSAGAPGDTDYIGQYEDDLADVIAQIRAGQPGGKIILAGHSMGGGIVLRYAQKSGRPPVDGYLLFAPYLGWTSPTTPKEAGDPKAAQAMRVHVPRILGLTLMNAAGITAFNGLRTYFFNLPAELPLRSYSYRAMAGMSPEDYRPALGAVDKPLLVVVGSRDEAFKADEYELVIRSYSKGAVTLIPEATHDGVLQDARTMAAVSPWIAKL